MTRMDCARWGLWLLVGAGTTPAPATFHLMQIEKVIAGVHGDTSAQAIVLRMRGGFQNFVSAARIIAADADGLNPVTIIDFTQDVPNGSLGDRILIATPAFVAATDPPAVPDFFMDNPIPPDDLAAGTLTFEADFGVIYWRLSWGGAAYTGPTTGSITNDADGDFGPPWPGPLPSADTRALEFQGAANAPSTNNAADYTLSTSDAVVTNNAGDSFTVTGEACPEDLTGDGAIDLADLSVLLSEFGVLCSPDPCTADIDHDGDVDLADLSSLLAVFGTSCP